MIVSDTGPLNYLVQIQQTQLLPPLFGQVFIPFEVREELQHEGMPREVRNWLETSPAWLTMLGPGPRIVSTSGLHPGELAAMDLAERRRLTLLVDDQPAKREAIRRRIPVIGTVGVLYQGGVAGLVDFQEQFEALLKTNFHLSDKLQVDYRNLWRAFQGTK